MAFTITHALRWWVREFPDRVAISVDDRTLTYGELYAWSARVAAYLTDLGVKPRDRVAVVAVNSMEYAVVSVALVRIGAIVAPLSFRSTSREIAESCAALTPVLLFADEERAAVAAEAWGAGSDRAVKQLGDVVALQTASGPVPEVTYEPGDEDPVFIIGTSGSTGPPKGVVETHRAVVQYSAEFVLMEPRCGSGASALVVGPFSSSSGMLLLMQFIVAGNTLFIERRFIPDRALQLLVQHRITIFLAATIFFERIAALPEFGRADLSSLYFSQVGGSRISVALLKAWRNKGVILRQAYGCTEAGGAWAARNDTATSAPEKCGHGAMFTDFAIRTEEGGRAPAGVPGEILIRSAAISAGYWNRPEATQAVIRDGWLHTGDLGVMDADGNMTFIDRIKDIVISGGLNVSARELEGIIAEVRGVEEVAVIAADDAEFGETPLAVVYGDSRVLTNSLIVEHCLEQLARYKVPRYVVIEPEPLPRLPSGKISKTALRGKYKAASTFLQKVR
jgi:fatty-acyl-CoA synthase